MALSGFPRTLVPIIVKVCISIIIIIIIMLLCEFQIYEQYMMALAEYMEAPTQGPFKSVTTVTLTHTIFLFSSD